MPKKVAASFENDIVAFSDYWKYVHNKRDISLTLRNYEYLL